jgi:hypothetical protein
VGRRVACWLATAAGVTAAIGAIQAPAARGDGDPASDILLYRPAYLPLALSASPVSSKLQRALDEAHRAGQPLKLAVIADRKDLGLKPQYFGRPQKYAQFLAGELSAYNILVPHGHFGRDPLLVVMPGGFGTHGFSAASAAKLRSIAVPTHARSDALGQAAGLAVQSLAAANGHPIPAVFSKPPVGRSRALLWVLLGVFAAGCVLTALLVKRRIHGRTGSE